MDVMNFLPPIGKLYAQGNYERAYAEVERLWNSLPKDRSATPNAYLVVEYAVAILLKLGNPNQARTWSEYGLDFRERRHDLGEAEFLVAKVAYEQGNLDEARQLLSVALAKSKGRILDGEDPKYRALLDTAAHG